MDAYEFSFVAVPAQRSAGVMKAMKGSRKCLKVLADEFGLQAEYRSLFKQAQLGLQYRKELEDNVVRLGLSLELGVAEPVLRNLCQCAAAEDLQVLRKALQQRLDEMLPITTQLGTFGKGKETVENGFLITPQHQYYSVLVLPPMELTDRLASILQRFADQGLTVLAPQHELFPALSNIKFATLVQNTADLINSIPTGEFSCHACTPVSGVVSKFATRMGGARFLFANAEEKEQIVEVILRGTLREPVLYSPLRDAIEPAEFARIDERTVRAKFTIAPLETVIVLGNENIQ
jgi:hypothetical protein